MKGWTMLGIIDQIAKQTEMLMIIYGKLRL
uniref:Uncharacterized protein n=1 Tax=Arundo donax TaxID=35708 RepID=A0A0A8YI41_ARUDO